MPVIRRESKSVIPGDAGALGNQPTPADSRPEPKSDPGPAPDLAVEIRALAGTLRDIQVAMQEQTFKTQSRVVRGLEALDNRQEQRQSAAQSALDAAKGDLSTRLEDLKHELRLIDRSARRQIAELSTSVYSTLDGMVEVLGYLKAEIAAIHYSLDASRSEARMQSESSRNPDEESV